MGILGNYNGNDEMLTIRQAKTTGTFILDFETTRNSQYGRQTREVNFI
jgi:hypothetical protein